MSIETFSPLPLTTFGSWITLLDPSDVPAGLSPSLSDVDFFPGGVRTRPGLVSQLTGVGGGPQINGLKTYVTPGLAQRCLLLDSLGNLYREISAGTVTPIVGAHVAPNLYMSSRTHFGREYMAFSDGAIGQDLPRQYDDANFDRVSQIGPAEGPTVADTSGTGNVPPGAHQCVVVFVTRQRYWTAPSPASTWSAAGSRAVSVTNIPTGPSNVVQRLLAFTAAGGANFYHVPATMVINDNTTTSLTVDFTDTILLSGVSMDYLFSQIELPEQAGVIDYAERLFWWGERARMGNWRNLSFDGGWDSAGNGRPLGWTLDVGLGLGAGKEASNTVWGDAYKITADGSTLVRGMVEQSAINGADGNPLCVPGVDYSIRARAARTTNLSQGTLRINAFSPTAGQIGTGLAITTSQATVNYQEFTA